MDKACCSSCKKAFSTVLARDRHQLRCKLTARTRKKACSECTRSKVRCDQARPVCQRCSVHRLGCVYQGHVVDEGGDSQFRNSVEAAELNRIPWADQLSFDFLPLNAPGLEAIPDWALCPLDLPVQHGMDSQFYTTPPTVSEAFPTPESMPHSEACPPVDDLWTCIKDGPALIESNIRHYPSQLVQGIEAPPFVHRQHFDPASRPDALAVAASLAQMDMTLPGESKALVADMIKSKIDHMQIQVHKTDMFHNLASLQAIIIYSIMRLSSQGRKQDSLVELTLQRTAQVISINQILLRSALLPLGLVRSADPWQHIFMRNVSHILQPLAAQPDNWKQWIAKESFHRSFFIWNALDIMSRSRTDLPIPFCPSYVDSQLPAPRPVWDATTAALYTLVRSKIRLIITHSRESKSETPPFII
jgi:hypothetical protein